MDEGELRDTMADILEENNCPTRGLSREILLYNHVRLTKKRVHCAY